MSATEPSPLKTLTLGDLLKEPFPKREFLITPWLRSGESALVYAAPGVGKSLFALSLALSVAGGGDFLDWNAPEKKRVLYVDG